LILVSGFSLSRFVAPVLVLSAVLVAWPGAVSAAGPAKQTADTATTTPAPSAESLQSASQALNDMELVRPVLDLHLTRSQIDSLLAALKETRALSVAVKQQDEDALKLLTPDILTAHDALFKGGAVPADFDKKMAAAQKASAERFEAARVKALKRLLTTLNDSLTPAQKDAAEAWSVQFYGGRRIPKKYQANPSAAPKEEVQAMALAALIEQALMNDRSYSLIQQYVPAAAAAPASDSGSAAAAATAAAAPPASPAP